MFGVGWDDWDRLPYAEFRHMRAAADRAVREAEQGG